MPAFFSRYRRHLALVLTLLPGIAAAQLFSSAPSVVRQRPCFDEPAAFKSEKLQRLEERLACYAFTYQVDGFNVPGYAVIPKSTAQKKLPVLIYNRGGNSSLGQITLENVARIHMDWADQGFIIVASQYRGTKLPGVQTEGRDEYGGSDVADVMALLPIIDGIPEADANRIGMFGISRGSIMTYRMVARTRRIKAIAIWGGISDMVTELPRRPEMERAMVNYIPGFAANRDRLLKDRSVIYWMDKLDPALPILLLHGDADKNVAVENASVMAEKLKERNQPHKLVIYPGGDHGLTKYRSQAREEILGWFKQYL
ncbi:prolyl oligopeptidase family serine peptidase [Pseudoduganella ginsengisoli]|uniref:Prolyl oligopeptidase family serine peptidase n=1 Tax=Pseudoduganella ginsengisoli TaxID=1462440 RepID=A0A6L6Q2F5_9BURK|nr:prolyl oligopeptidase family serine peptidase [Pseudoduganella ginsengisoli]MTW03594.1 prolyl oligopeptidase family serine peptidase [Pseudoduganella ginsengisoli]